MSELISDNLYIRFGEGAAPAEPVIPRRYTLTQDEQTGEIFVTIAPFYDGSVITEERDEIVAEWVWNEGVYLYAQVHVDGGDCDLEEAERRSRDFQEALPLALEALRYGDCQFFYANPELDFAPIYVCFLSAYPQLQRTEFWGVPNQYSPSMLGVQLAADTEIAIADED